MCVYELLFRDACWIWRLEIPLLRYSIFVIVRLYLQGGLSITRTAWLILERTPLESPQSNLMPPYGVPCQRHNVSSLIRLTNSPSLVLTP